MKQETAWAILTPDGDIILHTVQQLRKESVSAFIGLATFTWGTCYKNGYRAKKITITYEP